MSEHVLSWVGGGVGGLDEQRVSARRQVASARRAVSRAVASACDLMIADDAERPVPRAQSTHTTTRTEGQVLGNSIDCTCGGVTYMGHGDIHSK